MTESPPAPSPIESTVMDFGNGLHEMTKTVIKLEQRLRPICKPFPPEKDCIPVPKDKPLENPRLLERISSLANGVAQLHSRLHSILERLEL